MKHYHIMTLQRTFMLLQGVGAHRDKILRENNFHCWDDLKHSTLQEHNSLKKQIINLENLMENKNIHEITRLIPQKYRWLLIPYCLSDLKIAYFDIETTGLDPCCNDITTIAVYDGIKTYNFVNGRNLDEFKQFIQDFDVLVTFFGSGFDIPFCKKKFDMEFNHLHFDLCYLGRRAGLIGGLKVIEQKLNLHRNCNFTGCSAPELWRKYCNSSEEIYLDALLSYNNEDVYSLEVILIEIYNRLVSNENNTSTKLQLPQLYTQNPYKINNQVQKWIKQQSQHHLLPPISQDRYLATSW